MSRIQSPWTDEQVASLNAYQNAGYVHPFTHGDGADKVDLIATRDGWVRQPGGRVVQTWAHDFMADGSWRNPAFETRPSNTHVRVGVAAIIRRHGGILMGRRKGSHGAGTWSFPGGHMELWESAAQTAARETREETGLVIPPSAFRQYTFTNDVFVVDQKHYVTLYMETSHSEGQPRVVEPDKCDEWVWQAGHPSPLFLPVENMLRSGFDPWRPSKDGGK
jgi:8-oxo-dGTP diphosphatase